MFSGLPSHPMNYLKFPKHIFFQRPIICTYSVSPGETLYVQIYENYRRHTISTSLISYILSLSITSKSPFWILQNCSGSCLFGARILGNSQSEPLSPYTGLHKAGIVCRSSLKSIPLYSLSKTMQSIVKLHQNRLDYFLNLKILWSFQFWFSSCKSKS